MNKVKAFIVRHKNAFAVSAVPVVMSLASVASHAADPVPDVSTAIEPVMASFGSIALQIGGALVGMVVVILGASAAWLTLKVCVNAALGFMRKIFK